MSFIAGDILIRMAADVASLKTDMDRAKSAVSEGVNVMKGAAAALGAAFSAQMFAGWMKSAIDAADQMSDLSQRTGIAVEDIAGLQLAFKFGGVEAGAFSTSMFKLSKAVFEGNDGLKMLGIETRNTDGTIRDIKDVLYDTVDAFAGIEDGTAKSALAMEIFGKSGAELIPMLNLGSDGLRELDEMARKLGLTMSKETADAAGEFNDTLDLLIAGTQGIARQVSAQILPTLQSLAGTFLEVATEGDLVAKTADVISFSLKSLFSGGILVVEVFNTVGKTIGAAAAQLMAVMNGEFKQARDIGIAWSQDIRKDWGGTADSLKKVWTDSGGETVKSMTDTQSALRKLTAVTKEQEEANKKAAEAAAKHNAELDKAAQAIKMEAAGYSADFLEKLQRLAELRDTNRLSTDEYTEAVKRLLAQQPAMKKAADEEQKWLEELARRQLATVKAYEDKEAAIDKAIGSADDMVAAIKRETDQLTMSNTEREISNALLALEKTGLEKGSYAYEEYAKQIRAAVVDREAVRTSVDNARAVSDEWKKLTDEINQSLTDSLFRAFESGGNFFKTFWDGIKNTLKTTVLRVLMQPVMAGVSSITAALGFPGTANAATGGGFGGGFSNLLTAGMNFMNGSTISSALGGGYIRLGDYLSTSGNNTLANMGSFMQNNPAIGSYLGMAGNAFAGYALGSGLNRAVSGGYQISSGYNTFGNLAAGAASAVFGPVIGALVGVGTGLMNRAFGRKLTDQGIEGTFGGGDFTGQNYQFYKGGWFRSDKTSYSDLDSEMAAALNAGGRAVFEQVKFYATALKLPADSLTSVTSQMRVSLGDDAEKNQQAIADAVNAYETALTETFSAALAPFQRAGESLIQTMARLTALEQFSATINQLGGIFSTIASSSIEARESLIEMAGGIDALMAKANSFVENYYTSEEQAGLSARAIVDALQAAGLGTDGLLTREDFRALVESRNVETEQGREQLMTLLNLGPQFAQLADFMEQSGMTLQELVDSAPQVALLESILGQSVDTAAQTDAMAENIATSTETLTTISTQLDSISQIAQAAADAANAAVSVANQAVDAANSAVGVARDVASSLSLSNARPNYTDNIGVAP